MFAALLLAWYDQHGRTLPFRGTKDPYKIWVSEIMLQQTRTETVAGYYERFLRRFPDIRSLADAPEEDVLKCWEGLGYYSRARNMHKAARTIVEKYNGRFPADPEALLALPGVGEYTAAAVASIAFDVPAPAMDGNLTRVLSRFHGIREDVGAPSVKRLLLSLARQDMPPVRCGDFNQALMDIGASICVPGTPDCESCPLRSLCDARAAGDADALPVKAAAKPPLDVPMAVSLVTWQGRVWMAQRTEALLKNLWVYHLTEGADTLEDAKKALAVLGLQSKGGEKLGSARHVFTHRVWNMEIYHVQALSGDCKKGRFLSLRDMEALPIPTAMRAARAFAVSLLTPRFPPLDDQNMTAAAACWAESWQESHSALCSPDFLEKHSADDMEKRLREHVSSGRSVYVPTVAGDTAGVLILDREKNELVSLYLHPRYQGLGIGSAAVDFAVHTLDASREMTVTALSANEKALRLYRRFGFRDTERKRLMDETKELWEIELRR